MKVGGKKGAGPTATLPTANPLAIFLTTLASEAFTGSQSSSVSITSKRQGKVPWVVVK